MAEQRFGSKTFLIFGGLLIWAAHFMFVYSTNAVVCARNLDDITILGAELAPFIVMLATLAALAVACYVLYAAVAWGGPLRGESRNDPGSAFIRQITIVLTLLSIVAILWTALPSLIVSPCA